MFWLASLATASITSADAASVQPVAPAASTSQSGLTFPPRSDCDFLAGDAQQACIARRAGQSSEIAKVRSGEIKMAPPSGVQSSGGVFTPYSGGSSLGGFGESSTIPQSEPAPASSPTFTPNSIGNPWAGTPYDNGTGMH